MKGYVERKGNRWDAVIYKGLDPVTGRERRSWHPAGTDRADAERLARQLANKTSGPDDEWSHGVKYEPDPHKQPTPRRH